MPSRIPKGKKQLNVLINEDVLEKFRRLVKMKYTNLKGVMSLEVEQALKHWILLHTQDAHKPMIASPNPQPNVAIVFQQVKDYLKNKYGIEFFPGQQIHRRFIVEGIRVVRGTDPRTVRKWVSLFLEYKLIKPISANLFEVL